MAYVITGATGHIGNNLARSLIQNHKEVVILTRRMDRAIEGLHEIGRASCRERV